MTKNDLFSLSLKILGIYSVIIAISFLRFPISMIVSLFLGRSSETNLVSIPSFVSIVGGSFVPIVLLILLSYILIVKSDSLSTLLVTDGNQDIFLSSLSVKEIRSIVLSIVGLIVIVFALPKMFNIITQISVLKMQQNDRISIHLSRNLIVDIIDVGFRFVLGSSILMGRKGLAKIWIKIHPIKDK